MLVTGGAGYIGSHAAKALRAAGYRVTIYDNLSAGHRRAALGAPLIEGDIRDVETVRRTLRDTGASAVMHFAAFLNVSESVAEPVAYYRNNVMGTLATLEAMAAESCRRFVFSSTCAVYGEPVETPIRETHPTAPINAYGQTKLAIEHALPHYERGWGLRSIRLRYFNAAGADPDGEIGEDHHPEIHAIPRAIEAATGGPEFKIMGTDYPTPDGTCVRDYVHVADIARAHLAALDRIDEIGFDCFNVGSESGYSVLEVIRATEAVIKRRVPHVVSRRRAGDPAVLVATSSKLGRTLNWRPQQSALETIVATAWEWRTRFPDGYAS